MGNNRKRALINVDESIYFIEKLLNIILVMKVFIKFEN